MFGVLGGIANAQAQRQMAKQLRNDALRAVILSEKPPYSPQVQAAIKTLSEPQPQTRVEVRETGYGVWTVVGALVLGGMLS